MQYFEEAKILFATLFDWVVLLFLFTLFFFLFGTGSISLFGMGFFVPVLTSHSYAATLLQHMVLTIAPADVPLIVTGPLTAFFVQIKVAFLLALLFSLPVLLKRVVNYLSPALHKKEVRYIYLVIVPSSLLFCIGVLFAYLFILPLTFEVLYSYAVPIGAVTYLSVEEFVGLSSALVVATGVSFMLPVLMVLLSLLHIVKGSVWLGQWRYAVIIFLILSAIITPDGSGVSMMLLSLPITVLYGVGLLLSLRIDAARRST